MSASGKARVGLMVVCLGILVAPLDSAVNIALPSMTAAFASGLEDIRWVVICYVLTYSSLLLVCGKIGDLAGYRRVFQVGLAISTIGFICCALAPRLEWLLIGRVIQGIGIALTLSCAPALATTLFDETQRTRVLAIYAAVTATGAALGPLVGGALLDHFGWSIVFAMRAPLAGLALLLSWSIPDRPRPPSPARFDAIGALLLVAWLVPLLLAMALRSEAAGIATRVALSVASALMLGCFIWHERRVDAPIIRPALFRDAEFSLMNLVSVIANFAAFSILLLVPYYLVRTAGFDAASGGGVLALAAVGIIIGSWLAGLLAARVGVRYLAIAGVLASSAGLAAISSWTADTGLAAVAAALLLHGTGIGLFQVAYTDLVTARLPIGDRGVAGSLTMVTRTIGVVAGASAHSAVQHAFETAASAAGAAPEAAFLAGFQASFRLAASAAFAAALLCLFRSRASGRPPQ